MSTLRYQRVLVKLSGEAFGGDGGGIEPARLRLIADEVRSLCKLGVEVAIDVGGGNIWRKRNQGKGLPQAAADYLGLLGTVMNSYMLRAALIQAKVPCLLQSPLATDLPGVSKVDVVTVRGALRRKEIVIFGGGTGRINFTTDTAAAEHAVQIKADVVIKTGPADGVYTADPKKVRSAKKFTELTIAQALRLHLGVMDKEALALCLKNNLPIIVCRWQKGVLARVVRGEGVGTLVQP